MADTNDAGEWYDVWEDTEHYEEEVTTESATIYDLHAGCPLCGGRLTGWDRTRPLLCVGTLQQPGCGARILWGPLEDSVQRHPAGGTR